MRLANFTNQPLGMGNGAGSERDVISCSPVRHKLWIGAAIGAVGGIASALIGGHASSRAQKAAEKMLLQQQAKEEAWYRRRYNEDYIDTAAGQNLVRRAKDFAKANWKKAAGAQAVSGGTDAATAMAKEAGNKMMGDTIAHIASVDSDKKSHVDDMHRNAEQSFTQQRMANEQQKANNVAQAAGAASNAIMAAGSAIDQANTGNNGAQRPNLGGGYNNGTPVDTKATVPVGSLSDGVQPLYEDADTMKRLMQGSGYYGG